MVILLKTDFYLAFQIYFFSKYFTFRKIYADLNDINSYRGDPVFVLIFTFKDISNVYPLAKSV